ncbi:DUF5134 domain-containing protein [Nocardioides sp.]|uniref:DUF5134 domain-containing protein n=1 Tax=Nocardioides sp. TaxID=35761 RepID=UPI003D0AFE8D
MAGLLATCMVAVIAYCVARSFIPALQSPGHRPEVDLWHVAMGWAMVLMLLIPVTQLVSVLWLVVFVVGLVVALTRLGREASSAAYAGVGMGCAAMVVMLLPAATASASAEPAHDHLHHHQQAAAPSGSMGGSWVNVPTVVVAVVFAGLLLLLVARLLQTTRRSGPRARRVDALCEATMAVAMGYMLLSMS